ncbi:tyrosine-protein phosphatase non-receptor type 22 [Archocentrus centrarchus]|uniref:tyrosine-protein phosphatase non-receptor type 22 n=1 Tax=Archocentrus centrarchus TaxID=63155 RepID=UPI0011E9C9BC|nr:tyrosine-protein phosphatase non-receptor type 22-like [Archocentrus centrarchus]
MEQQAQILKSFLTDLERQETVAEEAPNGIAGEFARLKSQSTKYRTDKTYPSKTAEKQENIKKNRYKDILPFDHSRVKLTLVTSKNDTDYINASFLKGVSNSRAYIATQGPLPHTVVDFLRMLWEYKIEVVVMACREFEMGKKKCEVYWPQKQEDTFVCEPFKVYCDSEESKGDYLTRMLTLTYHNSSRTLKQLHYVNWPDHGVPDSIPPILDMLDEMRSYQAHDDIPICIHCSAGCGRTGALCVIDYTWNLLKKQMIASGFSIYDLVQSMRTQRPSIVQTKEQYELVYRTIKLLFQRYLQSVDEQTSRNKVTAVQSAISENEVFIPSEESDLLPQFQYLFTEERAFLSQYNSPLALSENLLSLNTEDMQTDWQQWHLYQTPPEPLAMTQDQNVGPWMAPNLVHTNQRVPAVEELTSQSVLSLNRQPSPDIAAAICSMVEDPYFDTALSSPSSDEAPIGTTEETGEWTMSPIFSKPSVFLNDHTLEPNSPASDSVEVYTSGEEPPPLPERTPESYILAVDTEVSDPFTRLSVISHDAAADAGTELTGSPPSPAPPLPERTPESFEMAVDQVPVEQKLKVTPAANLNVIGMSSEWFGSSNLGAAVVQNENKPFLRSKSLKVKMTFTAPVNHPDLSSSTTSNGAYSLPVDPAPPPQLHNAERSLTPPLPERTRQSFILATEEIDEPAAICPQPLEKLQLSTRVGISSEWDGTAQPKNLCDPVMSRSKSVRPKSLRQEPPTAVQQIAPPTVFGAEGGSAQVEQCDLNRRASLNNEKPENKSDKTSEKGMSRTKSLKFFKHKQRPKTSPPPPPTQPGAASQPCSVFSVFKFGFGNRFAKPKGPRKYPETWV